MAKTSTVNEMYEFLRQLVEQGKGAYQVYFDTDARAFDYHLAKVGTAYTLDHEDLGLEIGLVSLHEER